ncbi:MAG: hypothetical protein J6386_05265 [Candidatus Synoicihabitans palmerolidicus]|nr:hypothetical protein [Candidatus Synoicihabitans palmerolidicus]
MSVLATSSLLTTPPHVISNAEPEFLYGEWFRKGTTADATSSAIQRYRRAVTLDPNHAHAWRGLGLSLGSLGTTREASRALQNYLRLSPLANDRAHLLELLSSWSPDSCNSPPSPACYCY